MERGERVGRERTDVITRSRFLPSQSISQGSHSAAAFAEEEEEDTS
jgi:hypothetical protein